MPIREIGGQIHGEVLEEKEYQVEYGGPRSIVGSGSSVAGYDNSIGISSDASLLVRSKTAA
jgi:hypothetical protein